MSLLTHSRFFAKHLWLFTLIPTTGSRIFPPEARFPACRRKEDIIQDRELAYNERHL